MTGIYLAIGLLGLTNVIQVALIVWISDRLQRLEQRGWTVR